MPPSVEYHCPCNAPTSLPPPPHLASSSYNYHPLQTLFFCEECDAVRCDSCVLVEVSGYYCPNCLFEVPSASVRAEKNRCARNCFMCPICRNTLSVVPSDPPEDGESRMSVPISSIGEPPFFLYCNHCRWDSADTGITFEKPTGLATQLQKFEDSAPESLEFERLKEHFEPFLRASSVSHPPASHVHHTNAITAAASSALARDIPGVGKYNPLGRSRRDKGATKDEMPEYKSRLDIASASLGGGGGGEADVDFLRHLETLDEVASLDQRGCGSWAAPLRMNELRPLRIPLQSKKTKRCGTCKHILIKPEQKAQSVRYKIKLVAANYLPAISVSLPHLKRPPVPQQRQEKSGLQAGKTYPFQVALTNPLYDPIQVRLSVQRQYPPPASVHTTASGAGPGETDKARRPPFAVSLPNVPFPVAAFAEAWEYEDDEEMFGVEDEDEYEGQGTGRTMRTVGVLEKKANVTVVGGEVAIGKAARGDVKFNVLISYTYRSDDPTGDDDDMTGTPSKSSTKPEMKTFSFYAVIDLGMIIGKEAIEVDS